MYATISRWGNSQGIRLPKALLEALGLRENDHVELSCENDAITIRRVAVPKHRSLEDRIASFYGKPLEQIDPVIEDEVDWGKKEGGEVW